jgi:hypothetical protein
VGLPGLFREKNLIGCRDTCLIKEFIILPEKRLKAKDPHQLRVNSYRVLLTRGRDGFIVFVPNEIGMRSTYEALKRAGVREIGAVDFGVPMDVENKVKAK